MRAEAGLSMGGGPLPTQRAPQNPRVPFPDLSLEPALLHVLTSTGASPIGRSLRQVREGEREKPSQVQARMGRQVPGTGRSTEL